MRSLYTKIVGLVCVVLLVSALLALLISNIAYYSFWQDSYSQKVEEAVETAIDYYETHGDGKTESFYRMLQATGFQLYVQTDDGIERYGNTFRNETLSSQVIEQVKDGHPYYGMREYPFHLFLLGLFDNEVINTYGTSVKTSQGTDAIFVRPDLSRQIRELHLFVGLFLGLLVVISFLLLVFSIRYLVRPIRRLTKATEQMADGDYGIRVGTKARDEIGELSRRFDEMATAVEASDTERRRFVANVSHEFQSPLTTISGYAGQLHVASEDEAKRTIIQQEAARMSELTRQLLILAKLDEGRRFKRQLLDLRTSLETTLTTLAFQLDEQGIAVALGVSPALQIQADASALEHVFQNVIRNAVSVSAEGATIHIQAEEQVNQVIVRIKDEGPGMTEQQMEHAFERFYQGDASRTSRGTGLGLAIVKETMRQLGGDANLSSDSSGLTVTLTFLRI
ncbi:two-component sensor histidine kinase [Exiguobacterium sp. U13-1]|uniref:HAMP domain-containing sensor histidine kinase n=1 Tax=Exiguobacterium sp. U13-1 TaxID=1849031 RepID=UPI0008594390|nr:HAMP domain-containing sensor histidine kinase [Exiguobacterium sp. U13-1]AOS98840.1 two-component sensor histidine kinase [Exiguobacterium sp. U13-1]